MIFIPKAYLKNEEILTLNPEAVRLTDDDGKSFITSVNEAVKRAKNNGLDLVLISENATPPVCKILDYKKFVYENTKKEKEIKSHQKSIKVKEIQMNFGIAEHDMEIKATAVKRFLGEGNKVRIMMKFRGREIVHQDVGSEIFYKFLEMCGNFKYEKKPLLDGKNMIAVIAP